MGGEKEGDGRGFVAAARRKRPVCGEEEKQRGGQRAWRRKEELGAATGRIGRPASSARLWGPWLLTSPHIYTSVWSQDEADRAEFAASWQLWWSGSRARSGSGSGSQDDKSCWRIVVAGTCWDVPAQHAHRTAHAETHRLGLGQASISASHWRRQPLVDEKGPC